LKRLVGKQRQALHVLPIDTIDAFVIEGELVFALTASGRFQIDRSLRELEAALDVDQFARVHKSVIVNLSTIRVIEPITRRGATARLRSGQTIHISRRYTHSLRQKLGW
jgi:two-component system LytT family response regulator